MTESRHAKVKSLFFEACELPDEERSAFLDSSCEGAPELRAEVESLLRYHQPDTLLGGLSDTGIGPPAHAPDRNESARWVGHTLGRFEVVRVLDSGGMGTVLEGHDSAIDRRVAIKVLHPHLADNEATRQRFLAEGRAAGQLNHPNVVTIYEVAEQDDLPYLVMEFADGGSAADHLETRGAFTVDEATRLTAEACRGLAAAHAGGLVHRDVKPANLLLTADGSVKVSDFGIAKVVRESSLHLTKSGQIIGTPNFMSPEQCEGAVIDRRSDLYSLGATYYSLLVGEDPFRDYGSLVSVINAHCNAPRPNPCDVNPDLPAWCGEVIRRAMDRDPARRFPTAEAMEAALDERAPPPIVRRKQLVPAIAAACLLAVAAGWFALRGRSSDGAAAAAAAVAVAAAPSPASLPPVPAEPIRVGLLHSLTGTMAQSERGMMDAYKLAISEINQQGGLLGRQIESVIRDGRSRDSVFTERAEELIVDERVSVLFGCVTSSSRKAVKQVVEEHDHLLVYSVNTEGLESSPNVYYLGGGPNHTIVPAVHWAYGFKNVRSYFLVGSDYVYPRVVNEIVKDEVERMGARVVGERYLRLGTTRVGETVDAIKQAQPDMIVNTISGDTQFVFFRALREAGVDAPQIATGVGEEERLGIDGDQPNDFTVATYFQSLPTPANREFVSRFQSKFGKSRVINASMETAYAAVRLWAQGVESAGVADPVAVNAAMAHQELDAPSGPLRIDPATRYAFRSYVIGAIQPGLDFRIVLRGPPQVAPAPYPDSRPHEEWDKLLEALSAEWNGGWSAP